MAHTSDSATKTERAVRRKKGGTRRDTADGRGNRRERGHRAARQGQHEEEQGAHAGRAREAKSATRGATENKNEVKVRQCTEEGQTEGVGPRRRRGKQGANKGAKVHIVSLRKAPCR